MNKYFKWSALLSVLPVVSSLSCNIGALWGSCWYLSGPIQVSCTQVFPGHPDDPAVIKPMVICLNSTSYHFLAKAVFYMTTAVVGVGCSSMGNTHSVYLWDEVLPYSRSGHRLIDSHL